MQLKFPFPYFCSVYQPKKIRWEYSLHLSISFGDVDTRLSCTSSFFRYLLALFAMVPLMAVRRKYMNCIFSWNQTKTTAGGDKLRNTISKIRFCMRIRIFIRCDQSFLLSIASKLQSMQWYIVEHEKVICQSGKFTVCAIQTHLSN